MTAFMPCSLGFKEWAAVCEALAAGRQTIILRKGGIHEGREGFRVEHREFWLYPTHFHEAAQSLTPGASEFVDRAAATKLEKSRVPLRHFASVQEVHELASEEAVLRLAGLHLWSEATVRQRFHYRQPGLFLLVVRVFLRQQPFVITESVEMAGCKSWVTLPAALEVAEVKPVLSDESHALALAQIHAVLH